jgi:dynein heavy chain
MQEDWEPVMFNTSKYKETGLTILSSVDDIQTILDDHIVKTQTMKGSPFIKPFEEEIKVDFVFYFNLLYSWFCRLGKRDFY